MAARAVQRRLIRSVVLPHSVRFTIGCHALMAQPNECCGLLVGNEREIIAAIATANVAATPRTRFEVDPAAHIALRRALRRSKTRVSIVGVYHSHPASPAQLSERDLADAHYDDWVHIVVGDVATRAQMRAYQVRSGQAAGVKLRASSGGKASVVRAKDPRRRAGKHLS
jgi:desampylase